MTNYLQDILTLFKNVTLNADGAQRDFYDFLQKKEVDKALSMMQDRHEDVDNAIREYNPQTHKVMSRPNKRRKADNPYVTEKLPRTRQRYINEVELFFLLGNPIVWSKVDGEDEAFKMFTDFNRDYRLDSLRRTLKRLAGAETEAALVYHLYQEDGEMMVKPFVAARSTGYDLRPLFDQYGNMLAFALGYRVKEVEKTVQHWDIYTPKLNFFCRQGLGAWEVNAYKNIIGKIPVIYARQPKAWDGVEPRIEREEALDSKVADTNNYFADPIAAATADVIAGMKTEQADRIGQLLQLVGPNSKFEYINPPQNSEARRDEMAVLHSSILFDTYTPDFSYENIKGLGTLSGAAIKNAMILGYIKRANRMEIYGDLFDRDRSVIIAILGQQHPEKKADLDALSVSFEFADPFASQISENWSSIGSLYSSGVVSLETAVRLLALTDSPEEEVERIKASGIQAALLQAQAKTPLDESLRPEE